MDKKEFLLQQIIKAYLEHLEPIGSSQLKNMYNIDFSPATIRGYFKKLGDEGYLAQEHISSGRIPTVDALKEYWHRRLGFLEDITSINPTILRHLAHQMHLTVLVKTTSEQKLNNIYNVDNNFLVLDFGDFKITIKFNLALQRFLNDFIGLDAKSITQIASQVGAYEIVNAIKNHLKGTGFEIINIKPLIKMFHDYDFSEMQIHQFLNGEIVDGIQNGLFFEELLPTGYMALSHKSSINNQECNVLIIGSIATDYLYFYNNLRG